jgi:hypothetical protein
MIPVILYLASIVLANVLVHTFGIVSFMGLVFPAGAVAIGLTFSFRDMVQREYGKWRCWLWMGVASLITVAFNPQLAIASFSAFVIAEGIDWLIYTLVPGSFSKRVILSNLFGLPVDSFVFVALAFGIMWPVIIGQTVVKLISGMVVLAIRGAR